MSFKETWKPRVDGVDDADSSAVNEIAEAVIELEEDIPERYYSKEISNNLFANALKGSASGEIVALKDVSPVEHNLGVKVSSENIADIEAVKVKKYGKNIADIKNFSTHTLSAPIASSNLYGTTISTTDGRANELIFTQSYATPDVEYETHYDNGYFVIALNPIIPVGTKTVLSFDLEITEDILGKSILGVGTNGKDISTYAVHNGRNTFVLPAWCEPSKKGVNGIEVRIMGMSGIMSNIQLEVGETATEYEPCKEPVEYTVSPDGTVDGVKSIAPATTLTTDTEGVLIEVEYNKDANKVVASLEQRLAALEAAIISQ